MKKILLTLMTICAFVLVNAQNRPCPSDYKINNGGGSCPVVNGVSATGTVTLKFDGPVDAGNIPVLDHVDDLLADPDTTVTGVTFGPGTLNNNGTVTYCYYVGPNNNNNLLGGNTSFRFFVYYSENGTNYLCGEGGVLPVSFHSFTALRSNSVVALKWTTATESNNLGFEILRLIGAGKWETVAFISSQATGGNSSTDLTYTYSDLNATKGISQYRIRQVDIDNRSRLSEIRAVRGQGQTGKTIVYPNPSSNGKISIVFDDASGVRDISVTDLSGRVIRQMKGITNNNIVIENLTAGVYTVRIINNEIGEQEVQKFVVNKR